MVSQWADFARNLEDKKLLLAPFCGSIACEEQIKALSKKYIIEYYSPRTLINISIYSRDQESNDIIAGQASMGAKSLCIPFEQPKQELPKLCVKPGCETPTKYFTLFGRSY